MPRDIHKLRNIGIIAHIDAGKTTLTERMLYYSGAIHRMGEVDEGTTETDFEAEEQERGITIYSACVTFRWRDVTVNLIDTPGHVDFTAEVERSLRVLDAGVVVFSAREGVEAQSETVWRQADKYRVPRIAFINKMDREGADFQATVEQIRSRLGAHPVVIQLPVGAGPAHAAEPFRAILDLIGMKLLTFTEEEVQVQEIPEELLPRAQQGRAAMLEQLYDFSDELMERALAEEPIPEELIHRVLRQATIQNLAVPVLCGSALKKMGVQPVLDAVARYLPSPADLPPVEGTDPKDPDKKLFRKASTEEPFCGLVFKVVVDLHGEMYWVRVYSGRLESGTRVLNPGKNKKELVSQLWHIQAKRRDQVQQVEAGDIVGVIGLRHSITGDTLCDPRHPILLESIQFPETVISMAIEPESTAERKKLAQRLELLRRQDPTFDAREDPESGQTIISGMGELHLEIIRNRLLRDFKLNVKVHKPRVSYRETIAQPVEVTGTCQRQLGGQNLWAQVRIRMEPSQGQEELLRVAPGAQDLPAPYLAAVIEELTQRSQGGGLYGFPLINVKVTILGGKVHETDSNETAFRIAAVDAFEKALQEAGTVLLEPIMKLEIHTPEECLGDFVSDLQQRRATIRKTEVRGDRVVIEAEAPLANLFGYSGAMRTLSQGRATYTMQPSHYGPAPEEVLQRFH